MKKALWKIVKKGWAPLLLLVATLITFSYVVVMAANEYGGMEEFSRGVCKMVGLEYPDTGLGGMYDIYRYFAPLTFSIDYFIHGGEIPLWNPLTYCGMPNSGNPQSFLFYPPNLLRALLTASPTPVRSNVSLAIMWGLHFLFMAFCTYLLGRAHKLSVTGALTAAVAFAFSAIMVRRMCEYHYITSTAWLPLLLLLLKYTIDAKTFPAKVALALFAGLAFGMSILGGFVQIINLVGFTAALYALFYFLLNTDWNTGAPGIRNWLRPWISNGFAMIIVFGVGAAAAAIVLLPAWELGTHGLRSTDVTLGKFSDLWKWTPLDFYQKMVLYGGIKYEAETIRNAGIVALLLSCAGLTHRRRRDVFMFAGIYLILLECSFGPPLPIGSFLEKVTPFTLSAYSRAYDFGLLPLCLLAGYGLDAITEPMPQKGHRYARAAMLFLVACVCIAPVPRWLEQIDYLALSDAVYRIPITAAAIMLLASILNLRPSGRVVAGLILLALLFSETFAWNQSFVPYMARRKVTDAIKVTPDGHELSLANFRETDPICNRYLYSLRFAMNGVDPMHLHEVRSLLSGPPREGPGLRGVQNWEPTRANLRGNMVFKRFFWLSRQYAVGEMPGKREYYPSATTVFLADAIEAPIPLVESQQLIRSSISEAAQTVEITEPPTLFNQVTGQRKRVFTFSARLPEHLPGMPKGSAEAVHSALVYSYTSSANAQVDITFTQPGTDRSEMGMRNTVRPTRDREAHFEVPLPDFPEFVATITVENKGEGAFQFTRFQIKSDAQDEDGFIQILARTANTVDLWVGPLEEHRILTFLDAYYPGWHAFVDGEEVPIVRANEQFKAIILPPGSHRVYFVFWPRLVMRAFAISLSTVIAVLIALPLCWFFHRRARMRDNNTSSPTQAKAPPIPPDAVPESNTGA